MATRPLMRQGSMISIPEDGSGGATTFLPGEQRVGPKARRSSSRPLTKAVQLAAYVNVRQ